MGMLVSVYKDASSNYDCTNGGVSSRDIKGLCLTNVDGPFDPCDEYPAAQLVFKNTGFSKIVKVVPEEELEKGSWTMFGGNYAATSDSRFSEKVKSMLGNDFYGAVPIHDRVE